MALKITDFNTYQPIDSDYPYGQIKDDTGVGNGTNMDVATFGDIFQFFAKMMDDTATVYNDVPDNAYTGFQFFTALIKAIKKYDPVTRYEEINFNSTGFNGGTADYLAYTFISPCDMDDFKIQVGSLIEVSAGGGPTTVGWKIKVNTNQHSSAAATQYLQGYGNPSTPYFDYPRSENKICFCTTTIHKGDTVDIFMYVSSSAINMSDIHLIMSSNKASNF